MLKTTVFPKPQMTHQQQRLKCILINNNDNDQMLDVKSTLELRTKDFPLSCTNQPRKRKRRNRDGFESLEYHQQPKKPKSPSTRKIFAVYPNCLSTQTREKHLRCGALGSKKSKMKEGYYQIKLIHSVFNGESVPKRS